MTSARYPLVALLMLAGCAPEYVALVRLTEDAGAPLEEMDSAAPPVTVEEDASPSAVEDASRPMRGGMGDGGVEAGVQSMPCDSNDDCPSDRFCATTSCNGRSGYCERIPSCGDARQAEVCGCDGLMYFNDCLRKAHRVRAIADFASCRPQPCGDFGPGCPPQAYCRQMIFDRSGSCNSTAPRGPGACYVVPSDCGAGSEGGDRYALCDGSNQCLSACEAIKTEEWHVPVKSCSTLPPRPGFPGPGGYTSGM